MPDPGGAARTATALGARGIRYLVDKTLVDLGPRAGGISYYAPGHSSAAWARAGGADLDAVSAMLGHSRVTTAGICARIVDKIAENPARHLEELIRLS